MTDKKGVFPTAARIAIGSTTQAALWKLRPEFEGGLETDDPSSLTDDQIVAVLLGWHLRRIPGGQATGLIKLALNEYQLREEDNDYPDQPHADLRRASRSRSTPSTPGYLLTINGIDLLTPRRLIARAKRIERQLNRLVSVHEMQISQGLDPYDFLPRFYARYDDEFITDICIYFFINPWETDELEEFPQWALDEMRHRGAHPELSVKSGPADTSAEEDGTKATRSTSDSRNDDANPNPDAVSAFREFDGRLQLLFARLGLDHVPPTTGPVPTALIGTTLFDAVQAQANGKTLTNEFRTESVSILETMNPKRDVLQQRKCVDGLLSLLLARMLEASGPQTLALAPEAGAGGPYLRTEKADGFFQVSIVANFSKLEEKQARISRLFTLIQWTTTHTKLLRIPVYRKAWKESESIVTVAQEISGALVCVLWVAKHAPTWLFTTLTDDPLIGALPSTANIVTAWQDQTLVARNIELAKEDDSGKRGMHNEARNPAPSLTSSIYAISRLDIDDMREVRDAADILISKYENRWKYLGAQAKAIYELLSLFPRP